MRWRGGSDNFAPVSSDKIRAKFLDLVYGGARRALYNLSPKSVKILSATITNDGWTGACPTLLPPAGVRVPVTMSTTG